MIRYQISKKVLLSISALVILVAVAVLATQALPVRAAANHTESNVYWFNPFPVYGDQVPGATASLVSNKAGATAQLRSDGLTPGDAVTLWWIIFNSPENCAAHPEPCTLDDLFGNTAAVGGEVTYGAGHVIGDSGKVAYGSHLKTGEVRMGWFGNGFTNPTGAEIHLVVHTHGQVIPEMADEMISTFRAGCHDDAMINPDFPANAYNDGTPGPNQCQDLQFAFFQQ